MLWFREIKSPTQHGANHLRLTAALIGLLLLSSCGFQVRGVADFPADVATVYVQTEDRYSPFYRELVAMVRKNGLGLVDDSDSADAVIRVSRDESERRALAVSARNVPREYEVFYIVSCSVSVHGEELVAEHQFILTREYTFDETKVLGKANEEVVLTEALARDLVGLLVQTISAAK